MIFIKKQKFRLFRYNKSQIDMKSLNFFKFKDKYLLITKLKAIENAIDFLIYSISSLDIDLISPDS